MEVDKPNSGTLRLRRLPRDPEVPSSLRTTRLLSFVFRLRARAGSGRAVAGNRVA